MGIYMFVLYILECLTMFQLCLTADYVRLKKKYLYVHLLHLTNISLKSHSLYLIFMPFLFFRYALSSVLYCLVLKMIEVGGGRWCHKPNYKAFFEGQDLK